MDARSKSNRLLGLQTTLTAENLAAMNRLHHSSAANWLSSRQQADRSNNTLLAMELKQDG